MTSAEVNPSHFTSTLSTHITSPLPKRSRLSLRRTTQFLHKPCYKEDDGLEIKRLSSRTVPGPESTAATAETKPTDEQDDVVMIDLTQDENASPNCSSPVEVKVEPVGIGSADAVEEEEEDIRVWTLGLPNCGNTCFVNSILQVLRYTPRFMNALHSLLLAQRQLKLPSNEDETKEIMFFKYIHSLYAVMKRKEALMRIHLDKDYLSFLLKPVKTVIRSLREVSVLFEEGQQHDAHELLITTISAFSTACQTLKNRMSKDKDKKREPAIINLDEPSTSSADPKPSTSSADTDPKPSTSFAVTDPKPAQASTTEKNPKKQDFGCKKRKANDLLDLSILLDLNLGFEGKIRHVVQCLECDKRLERPESFANLEVNIPEFDPEEDKDRDSVELIECLSQATFLSGENKFFCEECLHYNEARIISEVITPPPILLLHFSWLRKTQNIRDVQKTSIKVIIPRFFQTSENTEAFCCSPDETYKLFAVVLHIGTSTQDGHYVTFIKDAYQNIVIDDRKTLRPKFRFAPITTEIEECCMTEEITNFATIEDTTRWLLFDDDNVSPVCIEDSKHFPYYNYLSLTASPCMIFYHKM